MAFIRDVIKSFDASDELGKVQREAVEALAELGLSKAKNFELEITEKLQNAGSGSNLTIPVTAVIRSLSDVRAYSASSAQYIGETVKKALKSFIKGTSEDIIGGVGEIMSGVISVFLGESAASSGEVSEYYVTTEGLSIVRIDMKAWYLNVSSKSIFEKMERVTAVVAVKSVVDLKKLDFATFLNLYQDMLNQTKLTTEQIKLALEQAKLIYKDFNEIDKINNSMALLSQNLKSNNKIEALENE
ncbi:MAG: hypothetical protein WBO44_06915 [Saprospiraceae bacterium]